MVRFIRIIQNILFTLFLTVSYPVLMALSLIAATIRFKGFCGIKECHWVMTDAIKSIWKEP